MATRTFLTSEEIKQGRKILRPPLDTPSGQVLHDHSLTASLDFSSWISLAIENRLHEIDGWEEADPIAIGSWGRGELCPGSDLDVIFCGNTKAIKKVVNETESMGLKFRYRVPEDLNDWTQNVDVIETNAFFKAKAFTQNGAEKLQIQKEILLKKQKSFRKQLLKSINQEKKMRQKRYDSIANFLEPNIKFGAGGLRDLHQAIIVKDWYGERFVEDEYAFKVLDYYKCFFLMIRQRMQLFDSLDMLGAHDQHELASWFGFETHRDFMVEVQKGLSRVSFHSAWVLERCNLSNKELNEVEKLNPQSWKEAQNLVRKNTSYQAQAAIRRKLYETKGFKKEKVKKTQLGKFVKKFLDIKQDEAVTEAAFKSHLISHLVPNFTPVLGLVQHDQYHRYSVDAHLLEAVKEVKRIYSHPKLLGKLEYYSEKLKINDWNILRWAALYHDIAKGRKGDHSKLGRDMVLKDLRAFGMPKEFYFEVAWIVENHLILSTAAFRKNPHSPQTSKFLYARGVRGQRLYRLAIFTVIDILATNPDAWSTWKANLLAELVETLRNPSQERHFDFTEKIQKKLPNIPLVFLDHLDSLLVDSVPFNILTKDFKSILKGETLEPLVIRDKTGRLWVRFHAPKDKPGLVLDYVQKLTNTGCNIRQAFINTNKKMGVYDWFSVKTTKSSQVLKKLLLHNTSKQVDYRTPFSQIELISFDENEWVFSFRAKDKKGLLLTAIQALHRNELQIMWAKVHTWGRQIDDIFGVLPKKNEKPEQILKKLKQQLEVPELEIL